MAEPLALADVKTHLRLEAADTSEDDYLQALIVPARRSCEAFTGISLADDADPPASAADVATIGQAMRLLIGNWYRNREGATAEARSTPTEMPLAVRWLLDAIRKRPI